MQATHANPDCMVAGNPRWPRVLARDASVDDDSPRDAKLALLQRESCSP